MHFCVFWNSSAFSFRLLVFFVFFEVFFVFFGFVFFAFNLQHRNAVIGAKQL